jgi:predicted nuclease with TOPRIM domain
MSSDDRPKRPTTSSSPPPDLRKERDEFLQQFSKGSRLSEEFVAEFERLRDRLGELETENMQLRAKVEAENAIRELLDKIEQLENEKSELLSRTREAEAATNQFSARFDEIESEFANLANLFVASNQIHGSLSPRGVIRRIKEVLAQLVGAESYCIYLISQDRSELVPIASEGVRGEELGPRPAGEGALGEVFVSGEARVDEECDPSQGSLQRPVAVLPLSVDDQVVGVIGIFSTLSQKRRFDTIDFELFKLLGQHAASALISASLFVQAERRMPGLEAFLDLSV